MSDRGREKEHEPDPPAGTADDPLLRGFLAHEAGAVRSVERLAGEVVRSPRFRIDRSARKDIIQESLLDAWEAAAKPDFAFRRDFKSFICLLTIRRCIDQRRRRSRAGREEELSPSVADERPAPDAELLARERREAAGRVLGALGDECRDLIRMRFNERLSYAEISAISGRTEGALRTALYQCLRSARERMARWLSGETDSPGSGERS